MDEHPTRPRRVFVMGRKSSFGDIDAEARRAHADGVPLVLVCVGYPVSDAQQFAVAEALRLSIELGIWFDAISVGGPEKAAELIRGDDEVTILASGWQRRRFEGALRTRTSSPAE